MPALKELTVSIKEIRQKSNGYKYEAKYLFDKRATKTCFEF